MAAPRQEVTDVVMGSDQTPESFMLNGEKHTFRCHSQTWGRMEYAGFVSGIEGMHDLTKRASGWTLQYEGPLSASRE